MTSTLQLRSGRITKMQRQMWTPQRLFTSGTVGVWYDPADFSTMFQDSAGTTPVTQLGQPVGLILDKSTNFAGASLPLVRRNLLTRTEEFDNAVWSKLRITVTPNQITAPNGTLTADLVAANATGALRLRTSNFTGLTVGTAYTFSIYAKKATVGNIVHVLVSNLGETENTERNINLDTNVISSLGPVKYPISSESVTDVGDGWKRYVISITIPSGQSELRISVQPTGNSSTGNENVYLWGAQLESGSTPSTYQPVIDNWVNALPTSSGNHAIQSTIGARPTIQARKNLLTYTEQFDDATWIKVGAGVAVAPTVTANVGIAPDGTLTADRVQFNCVDTSSVSNRSWINIIPSYISGAAYVASVHVKAFDTSNVGRTVRFAVDNLGSAVFTLTSDWQRIAVSRSAYTGATGNGNFLVETRGTFTQQTADVLMWGAQLEQTSVGPTTYQKVVTATDYVDVGVPRGLQFDGVDDGLVTLRNVDFSGTDKITVFTGVFKNSDTTTGVISELTPSAGANNGGWALGGPWSPTSKRFAIVSRGDAGTVAEAETIDTVYNAPSTRVLTGQSNISGDTLSLRIDGVLVKSSTTDQGAGNYANAQLFIGSRNQASLRFNGRIHQLCIIGRTADVTELNLTERFTGLRTGVSL